MPVSAKPVSLAWSKKAPSQLSMLWHDWQSVGNFRVWWFGSVVRWNSGKFTRTKKILASELMYALDKDEEEAESYLDELLADSANSQMAVAGAK